MPRTRGLLLALATAVCLSVTSLQPAAAATTEADTVVSFAQAQIGKRFALGTTGLRTFDCSGLVYRTFAESGVLTRIGGKRRTARGYFQWFRDRGLASKSNPKVGDLIVWGDPVVHAGIYVGTDSLGRPLAISALTSGVSRHKVLGLTVKFRSYLHVNLSRR